MLLMSIATPALPYFDRGMFSMAGARAIGMGGAVTAAADDSADAYWNPAGLALADSIDVSYEWAKLADGSIKHSYPAIAIPIPWGWGPVIGASQEVREYPGSLIGVREEAVVISGATPLTRGGLFYAGGNIRSIRYTTDMAGIGGKGFGGDAGFLLRLQRIPFMRELRVGAVFQDFDGRVKEKSGGTQNLARTTRLALAAYPHGRLVVTGEFEQTWNPCGVDDWTISRNLRAGTAFRVWGDWLSLRSGVVHRMEEIIPKDRNRFFLGGGVNYRGFGFDYAWASQTSFYGADTYMGASFRLGGLFPSTRKPEVTPEPPAPAQMRVIEAPPIMKK